MMENDPAGRFWAGSTDTYGMNAAGSLYCLHHNLSVEKSFTCKYIKWNYLVT